MRSILLPTCILNVLAVIALPSAVQAGPLLDWLRERCGGGNTSTGLMATSGSFTAAPTSLMPGQCQQTCLQTCQKVTVNYVPYTDYRTTWQRVPITQYRPVTSADPQTGCVTTCMRPCTDYQWQLQRIPYTTYRPVYKTQNYQVPVTTITNDCGSSSGCTSCGVAGSALPVGAGNSYSSPGFPPAGAGGSLVPADNVPMLGSQFSALADPYAQARQNAYRPTFPPAVGSGSLGNPYANSNAYSGMSTPSGYQAPPRRAAPQPYYPPVPSGFTAPNPETTLQSPNSGAERRSGSVLDNFNSQNRSGLPAPSRDVPSLPAPNAWQDPSPNLRWEYNTPPSSSPADQTVHRDVQQKWAYNPVKLASYVESSADDAGADPAIRQMAAADRAAGPPAATFGAIDFGSSSPAVSASTPSSPSVAPPQQSPRPDYNQQWN